MRKFFTLFALVVSAFLIGCNDQPTPEPPAPEPPVTEDPVKPDVELRQVSVSADSFTFEITSTVAGEYAYFYADVYDNSPRPDIAEWFELNSGAVEDKTEVTIDGLTASLEYNLFVVVRATEGGLLSDVKKLSFTTNNSSEAGLIQLLSVQHDRVAFKINLDGYYRYSLQPQATLDGFGQTIEGWVSVAGYIGSGATEYEFINGELDDFGDVIKIMPGSAHSIAVVPCDSAGNVYGEFSVLNFDTPEAPASTAGVKITWSDITGTSVNLKCEPDSSVARYHVLIQPKANIEAIINNPQYGINTLISLMSTAYAWDKTGSYEGVWSGLTPNVEYSICVLAIDVNGAQNFTYDQTFTTTEGSGMGVVFEVTLSPNSGAAHSKVDINITAENIVSMRYCFNDSAAIEERRDAGYADSDLITYFGEDVTEEQLAQAHNGTLTITKEDLWPEAEYTVIVYAVSNEQLNAYKTDTVTTEEQPIPARVESSLFESLQGEWNMSYTVQYFDEVQTISNHKVTISQGVDDKTTTDYRNQNRLVITNWAFQTVANIPTLLPQDLMESHTTWRNNPSLAYRDYGPKTFLEIGEGDVITMPTSRATRFYGWAETGDIFYFFGFDSNYASAAPCAFPVELSADGNTLTIKPFVDSAGTFLVPGAVYYPAVARDTVWSTALTDIVLTRVK